MHTHNVMTLCVQMYYDTITVYLLNFCDYLQVDTSVCSCHVVDNILVEYLSIALNDQYYAS